MFHSRMFFHSNDDHNQLNIWENDKKKYVGIYFSNSNLFFYRKELFDDCRLLFNILTITAFGLDIAVK